MRKEMTTVGSQIRHGFLHLLQWCILIVATAIITMWWSPPPPPPPPSRTANDYDINSYDSILEAILARVLTRRRPPGPVGSWSREEKQMIFEEFIREFNETAANVDITDLDEVVMWNAALEEARYKMRRNVLAVRIRTTHSALAA